VNSANKCECVGGAPASTSVQGLSIDCCDTSMSAATCNNASSLNGTLSSIVGLATGTAVENLTPRGDNSIGANRGHLGAIFRIDGALDAAYPGWSERGESLPFPVQSLLIGDYQSSTRNRLLMAGRGRSINSVGVDATQDGHPSGIMVGTARLVARIVSQQGMPTPSSIASMVNEGARLLKSAFQNDRLRKFQHTKAQPIVRKAS